jgi:hypothetical protein
VVGTPGVTKTATVSLHGNTYQVKAALAGRKVELVFSPFNLDVIEVRHGDKSFGHAVPHMITRHAHPEARPETPEPVPAPATGIAYLQLVADARPAVPRRPHRRARTRGRPVSIQRLQSHWGFKECPSAAASPPSMLHRHSGHAEAVARITRGSARA